MRSVAVSIILLASALFAEEKPHDPFGSAAGTQGQVASLPLRQPQDLKPDPATLKQLKEPSLETWPDAERLPAIRLIWVRTFHPPVSLRAYLTKAGPRMRVAKMSGKGGYDWGELEFENDFALKQEIWNRLVQALQKKGARQPFATAKAESRDYFRGLDGSMWTLEAADKAGYTVDEVWSPSFYLDRKEEYRTDMELAGVQFDNFFELCLLLIQNASVDVGPVY